MKFRVGEAMENDTKTSEKIIEADDYVSALERVIDEANLYCEPADIEAQKCKDKMNAFCAENNRLKTWWD